MEQQLRNASVLAGIRPGIAEIAHRVSAGASEYVLIGSFAVDALREQSVSGISLGLAAKSASQVRNTEGDGEWQPQAMFLINI